MIEEIAAPLSRRHGQRLALFDDKDGENLRPAGLARVARHAMHVHRRFIPRLAGMIGHWPARIDLADYRALQHVGDHRAPRATDIRARARLAIQ